MNASPSPPPAPNPPATRSRWLWLLVVVTTLLALGGAIAYLSVRSASYEATADVLVAPLPSEDPNFQGLPLVRESSDGSRPVQTAAGLLSGVAIARAAAEQLGGDWTTGRVESNVAVEPRGESDLVAVTATADSAKEAAAAANAYTTAALEHRREALAPYIARELSVLAGEGGDSEAIKLLRAAQREGDPTLALATRAEPPTAEAGPGRNLVLAVAVIVGFLVGVGALLVIGVARTPAPPRDV